MEGKSKSKLKIICIALIVINTILVFLLGIMIRDTYPRTDTVVQPHWCYYTLTRDIETNEFTHQLNGTEQPTTDGPLILQAGTEVTGFVDMEHSANVIFQAGSDETYTFEVSPDDIEVSRPAETPTITVPFYDRASGQVVIGIACAVVTALVLSLLLKLPSKRRGYIIYIILTSIPAIWSLVGIINIYNYIHHI